MDHPRIQGLDGVRALALLFVLIAHAAFTPLFVWPGLLPALPHIGKFGVLLFFVLSGYLQTTLLTADERRFGRISPRRFYAKRLLRILPLLLVYLAFILLWGATTRYQVTILDVASVLLCFKHVVGGAPLLLHFWSLSVEILFYIIWPLLLLRVGPRHRRVAALALVLALPATTPLIAWLHPDTSLLTLSHYFRAEAILLGCWLATIQIEGRRPAVLRGVERYPDACLLLGLVLAVAAEHAKVLFGPPVENIVYFIQLAAAGAIVHAAMFARWTPVRAALNSPIARWLALVSFGTYVWQQFFFFANPNDWLNPWLPRPLLLRCFWFPLNLLLGLAAGALSYYLIERPLHAWRERLALHPAARPPSAAWNRPAVTTSALPREG